MKRAIFYCILALAVGSFALTADAASVDGTEKDPGTVSSDNDKVRKDSGILKFVSDLPMTITSARANAKITPTGKRVIYDTNVRIEQGDLLLTCDHLEVVARDENDRPSSGSSVKDSTLNLGEVSNIQSITASGNVKIVQGNKMAVSGEAVYDQAKGTITLKKGNSPGPPPSLWQGRNSTVADIIILYLNEDRIEMRKGQQKRIRTTIHPSRKKREK